MSKDNTKKANLEELEQQVAVLTDALQRERADAMNVRRRSEEEKAKMGSFHKANVVRELLPVIDNFERSLKHVPKELEANDYIKGIQAVVKQFEDALSSIGVKRIETVGKPFDPNLHDAIAHQEGDGEEIVSEELQAGYMLGDEVIRHSMVKVKS